MCDRLQWVLINRNRDATDSGSRQPKNPVGSRHTVEDNLAMQPSKNAVFLEFPSIPSPGFATFSIDWPLSGRRLGSGGLPFAVHWLE